MRYTSYILNGSPVQCEQLGIVGIPAAIIAVPVMGCFLAAAYCIDGGRYLKLRYYQHLKYERKVRYLKSVVISLDHDISEWKQLIAA